MWMLGPQSGSLLQGCFLGWVAAPPHQAPAYWNGSPGEAVPEAQVGGSFLSPLHLAPLTGLPLQDPLSGREAGQWPGRLASLWALQLLVALSK